MASTSTPRVLSTKRDANILQALALGPLTADQLLRVSGTWPLPFTSRDRVFARLRVLATADRVHKRSYCFVERAQGPAYYQLTPQGYRMLHDGADANPPSKRFFAPVSVALHEHKHSLMDVLVELLLAAHRNGFPVVESLGENQLTITLDRGELMPDATLSFTIHDGQTFRYYIELDRSTISLQSQRGNPAIEDRLLLYDRHRTTDRFMTLFVTRSNERRDNILSLASRLVRNPDRPLFAAATMGDLITAPCPLTSRCFLDHRGKAISLVQKTEQPAQAPIRPEVLVPELVAC